MRLIVVGCGDVGADVKLASWFNRRLRIVAAVDPDIRKAEWLLGMGPLGWRRRSQVFARLAQDGDDRPPGGTHGGGHPRTGGRSRTEEQPRTAGRPHARAFTSLQEALERVTADAVHLGVPHDLHEPLCREVAAAGLPMLCEKPLAHGVESGRRIVELSERRGVRIGINYQYRYDPRIGRLAAGVRSGAFGDLRLIRALVPWNRDDGYFTHSSWHASKSRAGGGTLITQGSHLLDAALWIADDHATGAHAVTRTTRPAAGEVEDLAVGIVELARGGVIQIASTMSVHPEQPLRIEIYGSLGSAEYAVGGRLRVHGCSLPRVRPAAPGLHPTFRSLEGFRRWIAGGPAYLCAARDALATLRVVHALYHAAETGRTQEVPA
ncbi:MAG: Gfo/Idh/MocA family protein [Spirochaetota bacterium]